MVLAISRFRILILRIIKNIYLETIQLAPGKKVYFASDFHLGAPDHRKSLIREKKVCRWLDSIKHDAQMVFLCGDLFDFWFEYRQTVPKGYVRMLGKIAELSDSGIEIIIFSGNHDMWMYDYFTTELGAKVYREPQQYLINGKKLMVGHGDGLGPGDYAYKFLKKIFENKICRFLFGRIMHPNLGMFLGNTWAQNSWKKHEKEGDNYTYESPEKEILLKYCQEINASEPHDYYVFGHRHYKLDLRVAGNSRYINLGDWIVFYSYAEYDGTDLKLLDFAV